MINIKRGYNDWKELSQIIKGYKDLEDIYNNCVYVSPTNYNKEDNYLDMNYKTICATAHNGENGRPYLDLHGVEVWDESDFEMVDYTNYTE